MKFENPDMLFWLWGLVPILGVLAFGTHQRKKILNRFAHDTMFGVLVPGFSPGLRWAKAGLILVAIGLAVFALARPRMGFKWEKTSQKGVDIMIALDCSQSMLATDVKPSRLERAKREIVDLLRLMKSDRAGLVAFAGQAILQCPLTLDHEAFHIFLRVLTPDYLPVGGTNLTAAIETAHAGFEPGSDTDKAIILITDGESTAGDVEAAARKMAESKIRIFAIGVGDSEGAPIPDPGGGFKKDRAGNIVMSKVDEPVLEKICSLTKGRYVRSVAGDMDLDLIYTQDIQNTMERKTLKQGRKKVWEQRFQWFLFPCVLLLLIEFWLPAAGKKKVLPILVLGLTFSLTGLAGPARAASPTALGIKAFEAKSFEKAKTHFIEAQLAHPDDKRLYYNIGTAAYMNKEYDLALQNFAQAAKSKDPDLKHKAMYNQANTQVRLGKLDQAVTTYQTLLGSYPHDQEARENMEFAKKKLEQQKKQQQESKKDRSKDQKDQDQKKQEKKEGTGSDKKNPDQKKPGKHNPDKKDSGKKDPKEKPGNKQQDRAGKNQKPGQKKDQENKDQPSPGQKDKDKKSTPAQQARANAGKASKDPAGKDPLDKALENKLNRLEDKPGMALMPGGSPGFIEKDW